MNTEGITFTADEVIEFISQVRHNVKMEKQDNIEYLTSWKTSNDFNSSNSAVNVAGKIQSQTEKELTLRLMIDRVNMVCDWNSEKEGKMSLIPSRNICKIS